MATPRCKRCGRVLKSPASIARGMGPECAGAGPGRGKRFRLPIKGRTTHAYQSAPTFGKSQPAAAGMFTTQPTKAEIEEEAKRAAQCERRKALDEHQVITLGPFARRNLDYKFITTYTPVSPDEWKMESRNETTGEIIERGFTTTHQNLADFLNRYGYI